MSVNKTMKVEFKILYKNGFEDFISINVDDEETLKGLLEVKQTVEYSLKEDVSANISLSDEDFGGSIIRVSEIVRFHMKILEGEDNE